MSSTTLKPSQQQAQSTMSVSSATSSQHQLQQPTTSRQTANDLSSATSSSHSNMASNLAQQEIIAKIGLDHYLLIRFLKMLFGVSVILGVVAISTLVPLYVIRQTGEDLQGSDDHLGAGLQPMRRVEILQIGNVIDNKRLWATVLAVTLFSGLILVWSWSELMMFLKLRQEFLFRSASRYSSRVVLLQNLPEDLRTVEALKQLFVTAPGEGVEHVYLVRDVSCLEKAVKQRQVVLDKLEETESNYMNAIARASAMVSFTTLNMRSRSWLGRCVDKIKTCFGLEGSSVGVNSGKNADEEDFVGHLKLYQLGDVPKLSLTDLSSPADISSVPSASERRSSQTLQQQGTTLSNVSSSGGLAVLKWYQKPRRPRHYVGIPLLSKRQDSIRYYRGELCRLNKVIEREYEQQAKVMVDDRQGIRQPHAHRSQSRAGKGHYPEAKGTSAQPRSINASESIVILDDVAPASEGDSGSATKSARSSQVETLPAAFILMRTRAGAKAIASGMIGQDKIPMKSRTLGIPPRDIDWRVLGQATSHLAKLLRRTMIVSVGALLMVGCGLVVSAIASTAVFKGWERVIEEEAEIKTAPAIYLRQGVLAPFLLALLMFAGSWIINELCQYWGCVSKTQTDLLTQRCYIYFLLVNMVVVHPIVSLSLSWQGSTFVEVDSLAGFLIHAIPSYCSFAFSYILAAGLMLPIHHILQFSRLWTTLPTATLWSALGPLSWHESNRLQKSKSHPKTNSTSPTPAPAGEATAVGSTDSTASSSSNISASFEDNFSPAPTQTPRQAYQTRQPPFFNLQNLYPHLVLMFTISLALLPLAPLLFLFWIVALMGMNLCYRYLILQVVATKIQSGGLHYLQAIKFILFPALACPPLLLAVYLGIRQAWVQSAFSIVLLVAVLIARIVLEVQFGKREEMMLKKVEEYDLQPKILLLHSGKALGAGGKSGDKARGGGGEDKIVHLGHLSPSSFAHEASSITSDARGFSSDSDGEGPMGSSPNEIDEQGKETTSPRQRMIKRMIKRPTTIIGQYRNSFVSTISRGTRPKSVPVFDLERFETEILGIGNDTADTLAASQHGLSAQADAVTPYQGQIHSRNSSLIRAQTIGHAAAHGRTSSKTGFEAGFSFADGIEDPEICDLFQDYSSMSQRAVAEGSTLSKAEEEEVEKEVKYREIVKALRRASTVASRKKPDAPFAKTNRNNAATGTGSQQRRVRMAGATEFASPPLEAVNETQTTGLFNKRAAIVGRSNSNNNSNKTLFRASLPALLNPRPLHYTNNPYLLHQRSIDDALSNVSMSSGISSSGLHHNRGAPPSLPMLLIHRETVVAAKEWSRIQGLYLNPVLQEAKARAIVWLPSQTEQSFWGASPSSWNGIHRQGNNQHHHQQPVGSFSAGSLSSFVYCKYHAALRAREANDLNDLAISEAPEASDSPLALAINMGDTAGGSQSVTASAQGRAAFGLSTSTLTPAQGLPSGQSEHQQHQNQHHQCTCLVYQEVMKAVADAVALADQEIRDLRIVGLTVWLDSRHVIWGQDKEEDGQLGDRVMISTSPSMEFGGPQQREVGDGLLSWLEVDEDADAAVEGYKGGNEMHSHHHHLGKGAAGIIGGSMGVIMRRPIGYYGRLVGDGEEDDITRGLHSV
ncbi:Transmembrane protein 63C [Linnemannia gamsii]|uniref:Transmembrane protein 63C n=1 Tax=Linnemannia gamsii TaxID=64522 RepID=A0ABQ7KHB4_9FUNG|nr:Transmembrane protein 63C [Linnemannia gamsii]